MHYNHKQYVDPVTVEVIGFKAGSGAFCTFEASFRSVSSRSVVTFSCFTPILVYRNTLADLRRFRKDSPLQFFRSKGKGSELEALRAAEARIHTGTAFSGARSGVTRAFGDIPQALREARAGTEKGLHLPLYRFCSALPARLDQYLDGKE
jgi:hypothetical protein